MVRVLSIRAVTRLSAIALLCAEPIVLPWIARGQVQAPAAKPSPAVPASLPANPPSQLAASSGAASQPERHLQVEFTSGNVAVDATNASLNQVVREIARKASIKVTGNVADDKVFGHYGPSAPSVVLAALLDGSGSNVLFVDNATGSSELILTPRRGGPTPPNPNAAAAHDNSYDSQDENPVPEYVPPAAEYQPPAPAGRGPIAANQDGTPSTPSAAEPDSSNGASQNNGARSPQQIYEQLQKMIQQRQGAPASTPQQQ